jgi:hypothetical protein
MTRTRASIALVTFAASAAVAIPATSASAAPAKGLQDQEMTVNNPKLRTTFLEDAKAAKVKMLRFNTRWNGKSSLPDNWQVAAIRDTIAEASAYGIEQVLIAPTVVGGSSFNPKGKRRGPTAASKVSLKAYKTYIRTVATEFNKVSNDVQMLYAPLNEPNWYRHLPKRGGATMYRKLHNTAYEEIKEIDPQAKIVFGELAPYARPLSKNYPHGQSTDPGQFVREVLGLKSNWKAKGSRKTYTVKADGVSLHTYDFKGNPRKKRSDRDEWTQSNLSYAKADLRKAAKTKRLPSKAVSNLYLTEFAYKTSGSDRIPVSRAKNYLKSAWSIAKKQKVKSFLWYQLRDPKSRDELWQSGLKTSSGSSRSTWSTFRALR